MDPFIFLVYLIACGTVTAWIASTKGYSPLKWFLLGTLLLGIIGPIVIICFKKREATINGDG